MTAVGVVGLGLIGSALTRRLVQTGDAPFVFDVRPEAIDRAVADGARCNVVVARARRAVGRRVRVPCRPTISASRR